MIGKHKFGAILPAFGNCADRYCLSGYGRGGNTVAEILDMACRVEGLEGLELVGNWHVNDANVRQVGKTFQDRGKTVSMIVPDLWTQEKWGRGSFAAPDAATRQAAIDETRKVMDWAAELGCPTIDVWFGQDGYDYCFQANFIDSWKWLRDGLAVCSEHTDAVRILVEYKAKEPRTHCFINNAPKTLLLLHGLDKVGCLIDIGHSLAAGENIAEALVLLSQYGKLDYIHLNDNYRNWDDDMMPGSVHLVEYLELVYWIKRVGYTGWLTLDMFPYRDDKIRAVQESKKWLELMFAAVDRVGMDAFDKVIQGAESVESTALVRKALCGAFAEAHAGCH